MRGGDYKDEKQKLERPRYSADCSWGTDSAGQIDSLPGQLVRITDCSGDGGSGVLRNQTRKCVLWMGHSDYRAAYIDLQARLVDCTSAWNRAYHLRDIDSKRKTELLII